MPRIRIALLSATVAAFAGFAYTAAPSASACTGDVCNGICDFWNAHRHPTPKIDLNDCPIR